MQIFWTFSFLLSVIFGTNNEETFKLSVLLLHQILVL